MIKSNVRMHPSSTLSFHHIHVRLECAVLLCLVCLFDLAWFFLCSFSLKTCTLPHSNRHTLSAPIITIIPIHILMRDAEGRKKEASKVKQMTKQSNTTHSRQSLFHRIVTCSCLGWDSNPTTFHTLDRALYQLSYHLPTGAAYT